MYLEVTFPFGQKQCRSYINVLGYGSWIYFLPSFYPVIWPLVWIQANDSTRYFVCEVYSFSMRVLGDLILMLLHRNRGTPERDCRFRLRGEQVNGGKGLAPSVYLVMAFIHLTQTVRELTGHADVGHQWIQKYRTWPKLHLKTLMNNVVIILLFVASFCCSISIILMPFYCLMMLFFIIVSNYWKIWALNILIKCEVCHFKIVKLGLVRCL